jgi:hypothetical protein
VALSGIEVTIAVVAVAVGILTYLSLLRAFRRAIGELRLETERQLNALTNTLRDLQTQVAERVAEVQSAPVAKVEVAESATRSEIPQAEEVSPEILVVIAAAATAFLGKKVRIRSAKMLQSPYEIVNPWSQQGRVFVQASHNLRSR